MQSHDDLQQNACDNENQKRTQSAPDSSPPAGISPPQQKKVAKTNPIENRAQVTSTCSTKRLTANRENARTSTGPRTKRGKSKSSQNARKYSPTARLLLVRGKDTPDDPAEFAAMLAELESAYEPASAIARALVESVAASLWRRRRAMRFEAASLERQHDRARLAREAAIKKIEALEIQKREHEADLKEAATNRERLQSPPATEDAHGRAEREAAIRRTIDQCAIDPFDPEETSNMLMTLTIKMAQREMELLKIKHSLKEAVQDRDDAEREIEALLPPRDELGQLVRYENMINRQFHRALSELRRIRSEWGQKTERKCHVSPTPSADNV